VFFVDDFKPFLYFLLEMQWMGKLCNGISREVKVGRLLGGAGVAA
jgi:hypothetical protein